MDASNLYEADGARDAKASAPKLKAGDYVYDTIKSELYLDLKPGDRLTEQAVSTRFGVSRIPVREALQRLVQQGYLQAHLRNGYTVKEISSRTYKELMDARVVLEGHAVRVLASNQNRHTQEALRRLASVWSKPDRALSSHELNALNRTFHQTLVDLAGNRELARLEQGTLERIEVAQRLDFTQPQRINETYREHGEILEALLNGDTEKALKTLEEHIRSSARAVTSIIDPSTPDD